MLDGPPTGSNSWKEEYMRQVRRLVTRGSAHGHRYHGHTLIVDLYGGFVLNA